jgi:D-alanine-D-alanine ligase
MLENAAIRYFGEINLQNDLGKHLSKKRTKPLHSKIRSYIRSNLSNVIDNLEYMVSINSYVNNAEGVNMLGTWISSRFQQLGFRRQLFPQVEVGNILSFTNHHEVKNDVLILSHLDTVYDHQNYIPFNIERGRIYGSGVADSKGGVAILLAALQALHHSRVLRHLKCGILLTSDDSIGGRFSKKIVNDLAINSKYVLGTKYGNVEGGIVTTCSGVQYYHIDISNIKKDKGNLNIAEIVSKKNLAWLKLCDKKQNICVYINSVVIQTNPGRRSDRAEISLVVRFNTRTQSEELDRNIRKIASKGTDGNLLVGIKTGECRLPVPESKLNLMFFEKVEKLAKMLEVRIQPIHRDISSDICHVPENIPVLGGFGPVGGDAYSPNEFIIRDSLIDRAALMALVIYHGGKW